MRRPKLSRRAACRCSAQSSHLQSRSLCRKWRPAVANKTAEESRLILQPFMLGELELPNRVVMAPLTRMRAPHPSGIPNELMRDYYVQRASAGLIITEGTFVSDQ